MFAKKWFFRWRHLHKWRSLSKRIHSNWWQDTQLKNAKNFEKGLAVSQNDWYIFYRFPMNGKSATHWNGSKSLVSIFKNWDGLIWVSNCLGPASLGQLFGILGSAYDGVIVDNQKILKLKFDSKSLNLDLRIKEWKIYELETRKRSKKIKSKKLNI